MGLVGLAALGLSACGSGVHDNRPVIEDVVTYRVGDQGHVQAAVGTLSLDASRRVVVVRLADRGGEPRVGRFCAEPPPLVADDLGASFQASVQAGSNAGGAGGVSGSGNLNDTFQKNAVVLPGGSDAVSVLKIGTYALCQYHLNGAMDGNQLQAQWEKLLDVVKVLGTGGSGAAPMPASVPASVPATTAPAPAAVPVSAPRS